MDLIDEGIWDMLSWCRCSELRRTELGRRPACKKGMTFPFVLKGTYALRRLGWGTSESQCENALDHSAPLVVVLVDY
jgi:hypothetical protein